jgi:hypothetical protein
MPPPSAAASGLAVIGRNVLAAEVMERPAVAHPTVDGEARLTDSFAATRGTRGVGAVEYNELRCDAAASPARSRPTWPWRGASGRQPTPAKPAPRVVPQRS